MSDENTRYHVFVRNWYRREGKAIVPGPGRKTTLAHNVSWSTARAICAEYNDSHDPGRLSRKAEFTAE